MPVPHQWTQRGLASTDWFTNFMHRHTNLSIRTPEATSCARAVNFNKVNVNKFVDNLDSFLSKYKFEASSDERCTLVCTAVNAVGNTVRPMFLFPRKKFRPFFINNVTPGSIGEANVSGWMT